MKECEAVFPLISFFLFALFPINSFAQMPDEYVVTAGKENLKFVSRPELGYVAVSKENELAIKSLNETLRQFGARDIRAVHGLKRSGASVVFSQGQVGDNEKAISVLRAQGQMKYVASLFSSNSETVAIIPEIVVRMKKESDYEQLQVLCHSINLRIKHKLQFTEREYLIEVQAIEAKDVFLAIEQLNKVDFIEWATPNVAFHPHWFNQTIPNDTYFPNQWHLNNTGQSGGTAGADIDAPGAWIFNTGDPNIIIAVLDDGVDIDHPDLINNIVAGYDFYNDDNSPVPSGNDAHGTACAGLIAASGNNGIGVSGVVWNCKIMPIRIGQGDDFITEADIATAIRWAATNGADVMSNSWGTDTAVPIIYSALVDVTAKAESAGMAKDAWYYSHPATG